MTRDGCIVIILLDAALWALIAIIAWIVWHVVTS